MVITKEELFYLNEIKKLNKNTFVEVWISEDYDYPENMKVLFEYKAKNGVFTCSKNSKVKLKSYDYPVVMIIWNTQKQDVFRINKNSFLFKNKRLFLDNFFEVGFHLLTA